MADSTASAVSIAMALTLLLTGAIAPGKTQAQEPSRTIEAPPGNPTHRFQEVAKGVYFVTGTGSIFVQSNSLVIENEDDVIVVDSHVTPAAARALLQAVKSVTGKPVRYLINSHYHFDHAHGNQVFGGDVDIIGHEYTRMKLLGNVLEQSTYLSFTTGIPGSIAEMKERLDQESAGPARARLRAQLAIQEAHLRALGEIVPTPPTITLQNRLTLHRGDRIIELHFLGRGHTGGDVVVLLPKERVLFTGDLLLPFLSYMGDGYVDEWAGTLEALKALEFDVLLPGHGGPMRGHDSIDRFQAYLRDLWAQAGRMKARGLSVPDAAAQIDLTAHGEHFRQIQGPGADPRAVKRIYDLMDSRPK